LINTYRYIGQRTVEKDGQKLAMPVNPQLVLDGMGPFIQVTITHPRIIQEEFKRLGRKIPSISVRALIDTGASGTVVSPKVSDDLGLIHTGFQTVTSVQDEQQRPVYYAFIIFPWGSGKEIPIVSCPLRRFDCLIGRDILMHWHVSYNGPDGSIVICD
jgi:predicted aspartyl protease